jgi:hypothetical protein
MQKRRRPETPAELRDDIAELHRRLIAGTGAGMYFPPLNCACLAIGYERFRSLGRGVEHGPAHDDTLALYALAHESVHAAQLVTAGYVFAHVRELVELSARAANAVNAGTATDATIAGWRTRFATLQREIADDASGFSARDAIETQAVVEGVIGAAAVDASAAELLAVAFELYADSASEVYTRVLRRLARHSADAAIVLAPRLASFALGADDPGGVLADKLDALDANPEVVPALVATTPEAFVRAAGVEPSRLAPSMRERSGAIRNTADQLLDTLLKDNFDRYEALVGVNARLQARFHPGRARGTAPNGERLRLWPRLVLFADGRVHEPLASTWNATDVANWAVIGLMILDGFEFLAADA